MFFVAFLLKPKENVVIPQNWVYEIDNQWKKFLNNAINRNQTYLCFYSKHQCALDGRPNVDYIPNWTDLVSSNAVFPDPGCYYANLVAYKESFDEAYKYTQTRRTICPSTYNMKRLLEQPLPSVVVASISSLASSHAIFDNVSDEEENFVPNATTVDVVDNHSEDPLSISRRSNTPQDSNATAENDSTVASDLMENTNGSPSRTSSIDEGLRENEPAENASANEESNNTAQLSEPTINSSSSPIVDSVLDEQETYVPDATTVDVVDNHSENHPIAGQRSSTPQDSNATAENDSTVASALMENTDGSPSRTSSIDEGLRKKHPANVKANLLEDVFDEDVIIYVDESVGFCKPFNSNTEKLMKRENDTISGNIPFADKENGRAYEFGINQIVVPNTVVDALKEWNLNYGMDVQYDKKSTVAILLVCVSFEDILAGKISKDAKTFIEGFLTIRCGGNKDRMANIGNYIDDYRREKLGEKGQQD